MAVLYCNWSPFSCESVQTAMCKDNNNSKSRAATCVKFKVTPTTFGVKCKNVPKCTKFCSTCKLEVAAKNFGLLIKIVVCTGKYGGLKAAYQAIFVLYA